jgi:hypothetical protein
MDVKFVSHIKGKTIESGCLRTVLRRLYGRKKEDVAGGWRRLHNVELRNLYASPYVIKALKLRIVRWSWLIECMGEMKHAYTILVGKT